MNIVLVGFMGSGKTAVGRRIAQRLGYGFLDTDHFIEQNFGCSIAELFEEKGEPFFREAETRMLERLPMLTNHVISTGGGMLATPGNPEKLKRAGLSIFLNADFEEILTRLERDTRRPKLREGELRETTARLLAERMPFYTQADIAIDTKGKSVNRVAGELIGLISEQGRAGGTPEQGVGPSPPGPERTVGEAAPPRAEGAPQGPGEPPQAEGAAEQPVERVEDAAPGPPVQEADGEGREGAAEPEESRAPGPPVQEADASPPQAGTEPQEE